MRTYMCPSGHGPYNIGAQVLGKIGGALIGGGVGGAARNPWAVLAGVALGVLIGHALDKRYLPNCPECGLVLQAIGESFA